MGAGQSIPATLTHEKVFELTKSTRNVMDVLLDYMLKELTVRDFLALSNPTECKKYVIFMANNLYKYFYELRIVPTKDKKGVIAFRPVKELVNPPEEEELERQSLCLTLAYFYTRIFQIYGAIALTLIDDSKYMMESGIISKYGDTTKKGLLPPGYTPYSSSGGADRRSLALDLGVFYFLNTFLSTERVSSKGYLSKYSGEAETSAIIYFDTVKSETDEKERPAFLNENETKLQKGVFSIGYSGAKSYSFLEMFAKSEGIGSNRIKVAIGKLKYSKKGKVEPQIIEIPSTILPTKIFTVQVIKLVSRNITTYSIAGSELTITEYFTNIFENLVPFIKKLSEGEGPDNLTPGTSKYTEAGVDEELRLSRTIQNLTKTKPLGHCLARALQLLKTMPLKGEPGISQICKSKFFEQSTTSSSGVKTTVSRSGIPEPGSTLDTSPGMTALSQLFYDTIIIGSPKLVMGTTPGPDGQISTTQQYIIFMKAMARIFGDDTDSTGSKKSNSDLVEKGLSGIRNRRDKDLCSSTVGNIIVPPQVVGNVYDVVNQLYNLQVKHAAKCGSIIKLLFNLIQDKDSGRFKVALSENIIKNGFPEIERINFLARDVLMKYYTTCELTYLQGMKIVLDSKKTMETASTISKGT
jgi:hypothetical protein